MMYKITSMNQPLGYCTVNIYIQVFQSCLGHPINLQTMKHLLIIMVNVLVSFEHVNIILSTRSTQRAQTSLAEADHYSCISKGKI